MIEYKKVHSNSSTYYIKYDNENGILSEVSVIAYGNYFVHQFKTYFMSNKNWWFYQKNAININSQEYEKRLLKTLDEIKQKWLIQ